MNLFSENLQNNDSPASWRLIQRQNFTSREKLAAYLELDAAQAEKILKKPNFSLNLPFRLAQKITKKTLDDPILKQFLPIQEENHVLPGFSIDPVKDQSFRQESKLLHKYNGRALLVCTSACAMHCRYCFRQNFNYDVLEKSFSKELKLLREDTSIHEVILSGGDPLSLSDQTLKSLLENIAQIPHVRRIRIHTRFPIGIPERIDQSFLNVLNNIPLQIWFVIHANHHKELDEEIFSRLKSLQKLGIVVLNQAVLLRGVNDDVETLTELCETLANHGVFPYYLHQLDRVQGASHFEVTEEEGRRLIQELTKRLSGYAVPKYVREIPGESSKTSLM